MQAILQEFHAALAQEDLFLSWENELELRKQLRNDPSVAAGLCIENAVELSFLKRALYYSGQKDSFLELLYQNRDKLPVLDSLAQASATLATDFLAFISNLIRLHKPPAQDLQFLVSLYRPELHADFTALTAILDSETCAHLMARTANHSLREVLQNRQDKLSRGDQQDPYGQIDSGSARPGYPTLYGDKIELMAAAANSLRNVQERMAAGPLRDEIIASLLQGAEMLFRAGLIPECLALVAELVKQPGPEVFHLLLDPAGPYHKTTHQLLRKALPFYCLLADPADPHHYALELYRSLFPGFSPDPASLLYLDINAIVLPSLYGHRQYAHFELAQKAAKLRNYRPDDQLAQALQTWDRLPSPVNLPALQQIIAERMNSLPHESYTVMGVLLLGQREGRITFDQASASQLLQDYLQFFHWLPAALFMNQELWQQLGPGAKPADRRAGEMAIRIMEEFQTAETVPPAAGSVRPLSWENQGLGKQLLLSKYMGVL